MIVRRPSNLNYISSFLLTITILISNSQQQQQQQTQPTQPAHSVDCPHPSNYSDFTIVLINNTIAITGGSTVTLSCKMITS